MKYGVVFPQTEIGADVSDVRRYAEAAEGLGYDYLLAFDHVIGADPSRPGPWQGGPYNYESMFHEPMVLFGYLAGIVRELEFTTGILILPQRQTVLVAKQAAEVDRLSGGRLRLGIGVGWNPLEYEALGQDFHTRGKRQAEQVALLRKLWTQRLVNFKGNFHNVPGGGIYPLPIQQPIPIWFGGGADAVLRRMARLGDGWIPNTSSPERLADMLEKLRGYIEDAGRDPDAFGVDVRLDMRRVPEDTWAERVERLHPLGVTHVCVNTMNMAFSVDEHIEAIGRFKATVDAVGL
ncbi:MAG: LLM class F420-dependent oxidoreductase [Anaerolineae bacterium]